MASRHPGTSVSSTTIEVFVGLLSAAQIFDKLGVREAALVILPLFRENNILSYLKGSEMILFRRHGRYRRFWVTDAMPAVPLALLETHPS